jgi:hypothetical protein
MVKKIKYILLLSISCLGCKAPGYEPLELMRQEYNGKEIKLEGYYYYKKVVPMGAFTKIYFFYKNGVLYDFGSAPDTSLSKVDAFIKTIPHSDTDYAYLWGVFNIDGKIIKTESWNAVSGVRKFPTVINEGKILNDTTITLSSENNVYKFRRFLPKPDSTNRFTQ